MSRTERHSLIELIQAAIADREMDVHVSMPAKVESYDADAQTVDVVPQLNRSLPDGQGNYSTEKLPKLAAVPVCFPRAGGFFVSFPIQAGDFVLLVFSERNIGAWLATGEQGDPGDVGMHTLDGAVAIPGVYPSSEALGDASDTDMVLGKDGTSGAQIKITSSEVHLGGGANYVALANLVNDRFSTLRTAFNSHIHAVAAAPGNSAVPTTPLGAFADVAASKVKAT